MQFSCILESHYLSHFFQVYFLRLGLCTSCFLPGAYFIFNRWLKCFTEVYPSSLKIANNFDLFNSALFIAFITWHIIYLLFIAFPLDYMILKLVQFEGNTIKFLLHHSCLIISQIPLFLCLKLSLFLFWEIFATGCLCLPETENKN